MGRLSNMKRKPFRLDKMCDKCFKPFDITKEKHAVIPIMDDVGAIRSIKGHIECMVELSEELNEIYGDDK
ncbi:hypothetical protein PQE70_gp241 [Bacillus phage vB_BanS_Nate]|uniref:Uncharacterized protein n=1 Tax=Bacillus phage vB_BanS_Nate TaxID=2894788 RepID=A0AAE8YYC9_9CAUD|nr:hypothetical protein PQE70_gp241 [Bacillus phage vB_BanS_Nate]UGO51117.1 hypothetical protein NATE_283 [Bacillus phage vB_BanS_Nate]